MALTSAVPSISQARHRLERPSASKHPKDNTHNSSVRAVEEALILTLPAPRSPSLIDTRATFIGPVPVEGQEEAECHDQGRMGLMAEGQLAYLRTNSDLRFPGLCVT